MNAPVIIAISGILITIAIACIGRLFFVVDRNNTDRKEGVIRVYERLDEYKNTSKKDFVMQPVCDEKVKRFEDLVLRIEKKIDDFIREIRKV